MKMNLLEALDISLQLLSVSCPMNHLPFDLPFVFSLPGALAWNADQLSSGSRDRVILQRDIRAPPLQSERRLQGHRQEVCGLKWSTDHQLLASGGNDNKVRRKEILPVF